jgi:TetR/AcrR family transcriptional regulator, tetracycline repressor protein
MRARRTGRTRRLPGAPGRGRGLTREQVLAEARRLVDKEGLDALSMRTLAKGLGVTTMALYNHVSGKQDLIQGIAQLVVQQLSIPSTKGDWRERVRGCFRALRKVCLANPRSMPLLERAEVLHPAAFRPMEITLGALQEAGIDLREAVRAYFLLTNFTMGQVSYEIKGPFRGLDPGEAVLRGVIRADDFPLVVKAAPREAWDFDAAFEAGLEIIITGLAARAGGTPAERGSPLNRRQAKRL